MSNIHRIGRESTPYEAFSEQNPALRNTLRESIISLADCSEERAGWILQEITNALHRVASQRMKELGRV